MSEKSLFFIGMYIASDGTTRVVQYDTRTEKLLPVQDPLSFGLITIKAGSFSSYLPGSGTNISIEKDTTNPQIAFKYAGSPYWYFLLKGTTKSIQFYSVSTSTYVFTLTGDGKLGLLTEGPTEVLHVIGRGYFTEGVRVRVDAADYGGGFATYTPPTGYEGLIILAVDTNATTPGQRLYAYANGAWRYVDLT